MWNLKLNKTNPPKQQRNKTKTNSQIQQRVMVTRGEGVWEVGEMGEGGQLYGDGW